MRARLPERGRFTSAGKPHIRFGKVAVPGSKSGRPFNFAKANPGSIWSKGRGRAATSGAWLGAETRTERVRLAYSHRPSCKDNFGLCSAITSARLRSRTRALGYCSTAARSRRLSPRGNICALEIARIIKSLGRGHRFGLGPDLLHGNPVQGIDGKNSGVNSRHWSRHSGRGRGKGDEDDWRATAYSRIFLLLGPPNILIGLRLTISQCGPWAVQGFPAPFAGGRCRTGRRKAC